MLYLFPVILCFISVVVGGQGYGPVVGRGSRSLFYQFSPGGLPEWGHLSKLGLGLGCSGPCGCPVGSVSGSTFVLEGIV